jgi:uncharacterized protein with HEPN domain
MNKKPWERENMLIAIRNIENTVNEFKSSSFMEYRFKGQAMETTLEFIIESLKKDYKDVDS